MGLAKLLRGLLLWQSGAACKCFNWHLHRQLLKWVHVKKLDIFYFQFLPCVDCWAAFREICEFHSTVKFGSPIWIRTFYSTVALVEIKVHRQDAHGWSHKEGIFSFPNSQVHPRTVKICETLNTETQRAHHQLSQLFILSHCNSSVGDRSLEKKRQNSSGMHQVPHERAPF